jgi:hypothetical protein
VAVVDSAFTTALAAEDLLDAIGARTPDRIATGRPEAAAEAAEAAINRIATTGDVAAFTAVAERLFGASLPSVEAATTASD